MRRPRVCAPQKRGAAPERHRANLRESATHCKHPTKEVSALASGGGVPLRNGTTAQFRPGICFGTRKKPKKPCLVFCGAGTFLEKMIVPGQKHTLSVLREASPGLYLDGLELGDILLPGKYIPKGTVPGDQLEVFLHHDSEDRLVATTQTPHALLGQVAGFEVVGVRPGIGAFLDWGLEKDLLVPLREQSRHPNVGEWVVAMVVLDEVSGRLMGTMRLHRHLHKTEPKYEEGQAVELVVAEETDLGYKAVINHAHWGLLYKSEIASPLVPGDELPGFVRLVRPDGKIDLSLDASGYARVRPLADQIMAAVAEAGDGTLPFGDKTDPTVIREKFGSSKKAFKQALGKLLRQKRVEFVEGGFRRFRKP